MVAHSLHATGWVSEPLVGNHQVISLKMFYEMTTLNVLIVVYNDILSLYSV